MLVEKEVRKVSVFCRDGACIVGKVHINPGERIIDFLNDPKEAFIVVTDVEFRGHAHMRLFRLYGSGAICKTGTTLFLLKNAVKYAVEI